MHLNEELVVRATKPHLFLVPNVDRLSAQYFLRWAAVAVPCATRELNFVSSVAIYPFSLRFRPPSMATRASFAIVEQACSLGHFLFQLSASQAVRNAAEST
uniref:Uncharacterized protein n=1 Tax=Hyaloperonospora arabidopsidis (strain Emoy2) TaxID=559515 RepID=M4BJ70_HYAAE